MTGCWYELARSVLLSKNLPFHADSQTRELCEYLAGVDGEEPAKFIFNDVPWDAALEFGLDLFSNRVLALPFDHCFFQLSGKGSPEQALFIREIEAPEGLVWAVCRVFRGGLGLPMLINIDSVSRGADEVRLTPWGQEMAKESPEVYNASKMSNLDDALACCAFLSFKSVHLEQHTTRPAVQARRIAQGKRPLPSFSVVRLDLTSHTRAENGGSHASPRPHWRRGHVRVLASGKRAIVSPHPVMGGEHIKKQTYII